MNYRTTEGTTPYGTSEDSFGCSFHDSYPEESILYNDYHQQSNNEDLLAVISTNQMFSPTTSRSVFPLNTLSLYIQMEYCSNGSLRDVLHQYDTPLSIRIEYFRQVELWLY